MSFRTKALALPLALLQACVFVPKTREVYDADCRIFSRQAVLEHTELGELGRCSNQECVGALLFAGVISSASAIISGTIVVAGNTVYWLEKQGRCNRVAAVAQASYTDAAPRQK